MIFNFLDKLSGFFDRSFVLAYWAPVFLTVGLVSGVYVLHAGVAPTETLWNGQDAAQRIVSAFVILVAVTALAYVLQAFTSNVVRTFEGYTWPSWLISWAVEGHRAQADKLKALRDSDQVAQFRFYFTYPEASTDVRPTRLGNVLTAAEDYSRLVYGANTVLWWPRLFAVMPDGYREQIASALVPMLSLLNLSAGCVLVALGGTAYLVVVDTRWWTVVIVFAGGMLLARLCYGSAVAQASAYGNLIRSAFDLYRHKIFETMGIFIPKT